MLFYISNKLTDIPLPDQNQNKPDEYSCSGVSGYLFSPWSADIMRLPGDKIAIQLNPRK